MKKRATLADIARAADVSLMTVSRAINNKPGVGEDVRQRVLALAQEMDYRPNVIARSLATSQTTTIGLVVPDITNPFFAQIARGVEDAAYENRYTIFLVNTNEEIQRELAALDSLWQKDIDGVILCSPRLSEIALEEQIQRFPAMVLLNREVDRPHANLITINVNDQRGAQQVIQHFLEHGRSRIAYIGGPASSFSSQRRLEGYRAALKAAEISYDARLVESNQPNTDGGRAAALSLMKRCPDVDAIFAFNDLMAVGAMQACQEIGRVVPADVAVIGVDDIPLASIIRPALTTLHVNQAHIGRLAMRTLLEIIAEGVPPASYQVEQELRVRETS